MLGDDDYDNDDDDSVCVSVNDSDFALERFLLSLDYAWNLLPITFSFLHRRPPFRGALFRASLTGVFFS